MLARNRGMESQAVLSNKLTHLQLAMMQEQERASRAERERNAALAERDAARSARTAHAEQMEVVARGEQIETMQQLESLQALQRAVEVLARGEQASQEVNARLSRRVHVLDGERVDLELKVKVLQQQLEQEQNALRAERAAARVMRGEITDASRQLSEEMAKRAEAERQVAVLEPEARRLRKVVFGVAGGGRAPLLKSTKGQHGHSTVTHLLVDSAPRCNRCKRLDRC